MSWRLAIDFGTTATAAAIHRAGDSELIQLEGGGRLPSLVMLDDDGQPVVGAAAERQAPGSPDRVERTPKRRLGDSTLLLGGQAVDPVELVAAVLRRVADEARRHQGGTEPDEVVLTHPAAWAGHRLAALREAARRAGLGEATLLPEPVAAAMHLADDRIAGGDHVAVYDLGGGTFDCAVLRRTAGGFEPVGAPGGDERLGGEHFDELLYEVVGRTIAFRSPEVWQQLRTSDDRAWIRANQTLRDDVRRAKEALSSTPDYVVYAGSPIDQEIRVTREELEQLLTGPLARTVDELVATIERAGLTTADIKAVYLAGGSSRMPLVTRLISDRTGLVPFTWGDPKAVVALGAATRAGRSTPVVLAAPGGDTATVATSSTRAVDGSLAVGRSPAVDTSLAVDTAPARRRTPVALVAGGLAAVLLAGAVGIAVAGGGGGSKKEQETVAQGGKLTDTQPRRFPPETTDGLETVRTWTYDKPSGELRSEVVVRNTTAEARTFQVFEVIPKEVAADVSAVRFQPAVTAVVQADPVVRYDLHLAPGEATTLRWAAPVQGEMDMTRLEDLASKRNAAELAFREAGGMTTSTTAVATSTTAAPSTTATTRKTTTTTMPATTTSGPTTSTTAAPTTTTTAGPTTTTAAKAPGAPSSFKVGNPEATEVGEYNGEQNHYLKVSVDLNWSAPGDNGGSAITGYVIRCTAMQGTQVYTGSTAVPCKGGAQVASAGASATGTTVTLDRINPGNTWIRWEVAAVNGIGTGSYRTAQVAVPNVVGAFSWHAYQLARIAGLTASGGTKPACTVVDKICEQSIPAATTATAGQTFVMYEKA